MIYIIFLILILIYSYFYNYDTLINISNNSEYIENIKFVIIMATYNRENGKSIPFLIRSINSIINQEYKNWDLVIVGDKFEPEEVLLNLINIYKSRINNNQIIYINNQNVERDLIDNKYDLWRYAGAKSINLGLEFARNNNYKYYCHLDDDDYWSSKHLLYLANNYNIYPNCIFINTKSTYVDNTFLPIENMEIYENNRKPLANETIHSSISFRIDILPFYYDTVDENGNVKGHSASDGFMLDKIKDFIENNDNYSSIYIPELTCYHDNEKELLD